jgi:hypothetical protein
LVDPPSFRVEALSSAGAPLLRGTFELQYKELRNGETIVLLGQDDAGRRVSVQVPCEILEHVAAPGPAADMATLELLVDRAYRAGSG